MHTAQRAQVLCYDVLTMLLGPVMIVYKFCRISVVFLGELSAKLS